MSFALSVFDVFAYTLPGGLYLTLAAYLVVRFDWFDLTEWVAANLLPSFVVGGIVAFLVGHVTYGLGRAVEHRLPGRRTSPDEAGRRRFLGRCPDAAGRRFVQVDSFLLFARIQLLHPDVALEIARLRSTGIMLRHAALPLAAGAVVALAEVAASDERLVALAAAALLAPAAYGALARGREFAEWAHAKTLEVAYWLDDAGPPAPAATP
jgi:hypothetical protein